MTSLKFVIGPFVLPGFCSGARSLKPVTIFQYTYFKYFDGVLQDHT